MAKKRPVPPPAKATSLQRELKLTFVALLLLGSFSLTGMGRQMWQRTVQMYQEMPGQRKERREDKRMETTFGPNYALPRYVRGILLQYPGKPLLVLPPRNYVWAHSDQRKYKPTSFLWPEPPVWYYFFGSMSVVSHRHPMAKQATHGIVNRPGSDEFSVVIFQSADHRNAVLGEFAATDARHPTGPIELEM